MVIQNDETLARYTLHLLSMTIIAKLIPETKIGQATSTLVKRAFQNIPYILKVLDAVAPHKTPQFSART